MARSTESYRLESDKTAQFLAECMTKDQTAVERTSEVYARYKSWCAENGFKCESAKNFKQCLAVFGSVERKRFKGCEKTTLFCGYSLKK